MDAIEILAGFDDINKNNTCLAVFGDLLDNNDLLPFKTRSLGKFNDEYSLVLAYSAADVFVGPSLQEAFGQTFTEAMSCGTPCIAFNCSGPKDIIDHKQTGYLARFKDPIDLAAGIKWVLEDEERYNKLGNCSREKAVREYDSRIIGAKYAELFKQLELNYATK